MRVWADPARPPDPLGRPEYEHVLVKGTRLIDRSTLRFPEAPGGSFEVRVTPLVHCFIGIGTVYGLDPDWRHGSWQGPLVVQGLERDHDDAGKLGQYAVVDHVARFEYQGRTGYGLHEHGFFGPFEKYGMKDAASGAS